MRIPLKILVTVVLLTLALAVGTQMVAPRHPSASAPLPAAPPVVVRKSARSAPLAKTVRPVPGRPLEHPSYPAAAH